MSLTPSLIIQCKAKLLEAKSRILNQLRAQRARLLEQPFEGDEGDLGRRSVEEEQTLITTQLLSKRLIEIEHALARIEQGRYGICEETLEPIDSRRLLSIPWTRLSIEGAELREAQTRRTS